MKKTEDGGIYMEMYSSDILSRGLSIDHSIFIMNGHE